MKKIILPIILSAAIGLNANAAGVDNDPFMDIETAVTNLAKYNLVKITELLNENTNITSVTEQGSLPTNVEEYPNEYILHVYVPGFKKENVSISIEKNVIAIAAKNEQLKVGKKEGKIISQEFSTSSLARKFPIPDGVNIDKISAEQKDGILKIVLPKTNNPKPSARKIEIK